MDKIVGRILKDLGEPGLIQKLSALSRSDFNSLLMELFRARIGGLEPRDMLRDVQTNRYVLPSPINPASYHELEGELLRAAERQGIKGILLSPAGLLGSCAVFGCVNQNNVLSAGKGTEVLADPTNMLAILIADQIKRGEIDNRTHVHYCSTVRVTRGQALAGNRSFPHFGIFCIVSSGKDTGSYVCEKKLLSKQLQYYKSLFKERYGAPLSAVLRKRGGYPDGEGYSPGWRS